MTNSFINAMTTNDALTANGAVTNSTTGSACLDLFSAIAAMRGKDVGPIFIKAFIENPELSVRTALWARDVRGGAGERSVFRDIGKFLVLDGTLDDSVKLNLLRTTIEVGRWDDVWAIAFDTPMEKTAIQLIHHHLRVYKSGLLAKWLPRKGPTAIKIRKGLGWSPKQYRKTIVELSNTVEQKMCAQDWTAIEFGKLPSVASARYQKAFTRNCGEAYSQYIEGLQKGTEKINAGAILPHDVIKVAAYCRGGSAVADAQWKALPDYMEGCEDRLILPVVDVSGSMYATIPNTNTQCLEISVSLGMYLAERNIGPFKDWFVTFSQAPTMQKLVGTLEQRINQLRTSKWGFNTDLMAVFRILLAKSVSNHIPPEDMPTDIVILSDMEFDRAVTGNGLSNFQAIDKMYKLAGYKRPNLIFWNLNAREGNNPIKAGTEGTALVSGFSPSIMKSILRNESFNPEKIMLDTVMVERYNIFS